LVVSICFFMFSSVCFTKLGALMFDIYMLTIVTSSQWIAPFCQYEVTFFFSSD
jgi:hypothetical protein